MTIISNPVVPADHIMEGVRADQIGIGIHMNVCSIGIENHLIGQDRSGHVPDRDHTTSVFILSLGNLA